MRLLIVSALLVACLALGFPQPAGAQGRDATPSARELWETYPLDATPKAGARTVEPSRPASATPGRVQPAQSSSSALTAVVAATLALLAFGVGFVLSVRRPRRRSRSSAAPPPPPADQPALKPPAWARAWSAEIEWHVAAGEGRFRAVARTADGRDSAILGESPPVQWPPSRDAGVPTLTTAAQELERRLAAAGWRPLPPGDAWYAKRFAWDPGAWTPPRRFNRRHSQRGPSETVT